MGTELLQHQLDRELREEHEISFSEYEILVRLSEADERTHADGAARRRDVPLPQPGDAHHRPDGEGRSRAPHAARVRRPRGRGRDDRRGPRKLSRPRPRTSAASARTWWTSPRATDFAALGRIFNEVSDRLLPGKPEDADIR